jgi:hypothetical protein
MSLKTQGDQLSERAREIKRKLLKRLVRIMVKEKAIKNEIVKIIFLVTNYFR